MTSNLIAIAWSLVAYKLCFLFHIYINKECTNTTILTTTLVYILIVSIMESHLHIIHSNTTPTLTLHQYNTNHPHTKNIITTSPHKYNYRISMYTQLKTCLIVTLISLRNTTYYTILNAYSLPLHTYPIRTILVVPICTPYLLVKFALFLTRTTLFVKINYTTYKRYIPPHPFPTKNNHLHKKQHFTSHNTNTNPSKRHITKLTQYLLKILTFITALILTQTHYNTLTPHLSTSHQNQHTIYQYHLQSQHHHHQPTTSSRHYNHFPTILHFTQHTIHTPIIPNYRP